MRKTYNNILDTIILGTLIILLIISYIYNTIETERNNTEEVITEEQIIEIRDKINDLELEINNIKEKVKEETIIKQEIGAGEYKGIFIATAYDLTVASCGKKENNPNYGITKSGYSLKGLDRKSAMTIATDPKIIPLGTKVYIEFLDKEWQHWNGIYTSRDTGSAIKGNKIDIFYKDTGDSKQDKQVREFGRRKCKIIVLDT